MTDVKALLKGLAEDIKAEVLRRMSSSIGINPRTGTNTLVGSDLYNSVNTTVDGDNTIVFSILQHWEYVALGWKHTGRFPGTKHLFLQNLSDWIDRKNVHLGNMTHTQMVYVIYRKINMEGIKARPFLTYDPHEDPSVIMPFLNDFFDSFADKVFDEITKEIDKKFT